MLMSSESQSVVEQGRLLRVLGVWFGIAAAVGNTIAAGIVRTPGNLAQVLPDPLWFCLVWVIGGLYALCGASSLAELGACIRRSGGQYNFARRALGDYAGFVVGYSDWLSCCGTMGAVAIVIGEYSVKLGALHPFLEKPIALLIVIAFTLLQCGGVKWGEGAQLITAAIKSIAFVVLALACFAFVPGYGTGAAAPHVVRGPVTFDLAFAGALMLALQSVFYTMDGWNGVVYFGEEVKDAGQDVPRAIFGSVLSITSIYLLLNVALLKVLPLNEIAGNKFALGAAAQRIFGAYGDPVIRSIMILSLISCINAVQLFASRILYAMSSDGLFLRAFARVNRGGTPVPALILSSAVAVVFILGSFEKVIAMLSFFFVANYALSYTSLFILRRKEPGLERPYLAWGYPWTTALALLGSVAFLLGSLASDKENAPAALVLLLITYPFFLLLKRYLKPDES